MKGDLLFELGTEELPPKSLIELSSAFSSDFKARLIAMGLTFTSLVSYATPRRLAVVIKDLDVAVPDKETVIWGPPVRVCFDENGSLTKAAKVFAEKNGISNTSLSSKIDNDGQQDKLCIRKIEPGLLTKDLLGPLINAVLNKLPMSKRMRWGNQKEEFVRPAQWALLLFSGEVCSATILGLDTSNISQGHRFHGSGDIRIHSPDTYEAQLEEAFVIACFDKRRAIIEMGISNLAKRIKGTAVIDSSLLDEVVALNEWPVPILGQFEDRFLSVPPEALISSMKEHQKYFHIVDDQNRLIPAFITVANISSKDPSQIIKGNERVIRPRLADAEFFYKNDSLVTLISRRESLKTVVFQEKLGSLFDKTTRVAALAKIIATDVGADPELTFRAGLLCKSDLVTDMVGEFADLQGIMGKYYAYNDGEHSEVAEAQSEQYLPRFSGDMVPSTSVGTALALADRLDTIVGIFSIGQEPSGSRDPFALRRASLGLLRTLVAKGISLDLGDAIDAAGRELKLQGKPLEKVRLQVLTYILERFKSWYKDEGLKAEIFLSVNALNLTVPADINARVRAVSRFSLLPEATALASANKRVLNILAKQPQNKKLPKLKSSLLKEPAEKKLAALIEALASLSVPLLKERNYDAVLKELAALRDPVDSFFNEVMVMSEDLSIRDNRLSLLANLQKLFLDVADISQLAITK